MSETRDGHERHGVAPGSAIDRTIVAYRSAFRRTLSRVPEAEPLLAQRRFLLVALLVEFATYFALNGMLNELMRRTIEAATVRMAATTVLQTPPMRSS